MDSRSSDLLSRWRTGDERAADELFRRYAERLLALAKSRLPAQLARHIDPEDVVQSAYRSFFVKAREGCYVVRRNGDLWRLLVAITMHKLRHRVERHATRKRAAGRERPFGGESTLFGYQRGVFARGPSPSQAAAAADAIKHLLRELQPLERRMVELRLEGYRLDEIASDVHRSERTVRRILERVKDQLQPSADRPERPGREAPPC